jgi:hypothetical protein
MARFADVKVVGLHFVYGFCDVSARAASREYQSRHPDQKQPSRRVCNGIRYTYSGLKQTGAFMPSAHIGRSKWNVQNEEEMLDAVHANIDRH